MIHNFHSIKSDEILFSFFFQKFFKKLSEKFYKKNKVPSNNVIPNDDLPDRYGRDYAIYFACNSGNEDCLSDAYTQVHRYADHDYKIPNGLERIYCSGLRGIKSKDEFINIWTKMSLTSDASFKSTLINALGCSDDPELLNAFLDTSIGSNGNNVNYTQSQRLAVFNSVLQSDSGLPVIFDFLNRARNEINYGISFVQLLSNIANSIKTESDQMLFHQFLMSRTDISSNDFLTLSRIIVNSLDQQKLQQFTKQMTEINRILDEWEHGIDEEGRTWILPKTSVPEYYKIHLDVRNIHTGARAFTGDTSIHAAIVQKTDRIMFHSKNQVFSTIDVVDRDTNVEIPISNYRLTPSHETIIIYFTKELSAGTKLSINLKYSTFLVTSATGFFQTSYTMYNSLRYVAQTQFEETGARYAFPCYDGNYFGQNVFHAKINNNNSN